MNEPQSQIFTIKPAVPCAAFDPSTDNGRCNRPTTVASGWMHDNGEWQLLPICKQCIEAMQANYEMIGETP